MLSFFRPRKGFWHAREAANHVNAMTDRAHLRIEAEARLSLAPASHAARLPAEIEAALNEPRLIRVELEVQIEDLRRTNTLFEAAGREMAVLERWLPQETKEP